jgi:hypothetical protein
MKPLFAINISIRASLFAHVLAALALATLSAGSSAAIDPDQSRVAPPAGDGWQVLSGAPAAPAATASGVQAAPLLVVKTAALSPTGSAASTNPAPMLGSVTASAAANPSLAVTPVVLPSSAPGTAPGGILTLSITPQDINLRNALDRWLQQQGWQLAWKIDDDLPLEFNATFSGDFKSVLTQVMQATNHMRTPTRVC